MNIVSSGTQTSTIGTKHQLHTTNDANTYVLAVDTYNMNIADVVELYVDIALESGGEHRQAYDVVFAHNQGSPAKLSVPVVAPYGASFSLKQTSGTPRVFKWFVVGL